MKHLNTPVRPWAPVLGLLLFLSNPADSAKVPDDLENRDIINVDGAGQFYIANNPASKEQLKAHLVRRFEGPAGERRLLGHLRLLYSKAYLARLGRGSCNRSLTSRRVRRRPLSSSTRIE